MSDEQVAEVKKTIAEARHIAELDGHGAALGRLADAVELLLEIVNDKART